LGAKFVLIFALARFLEPADVGLYGLMFATITYVQFALGLDFYQYANRELLGADRHLWTSILRDQGVFFLLCYAVVLPLSFLLFAFDLLPWKFVGWFFVLLVMEHLSHELCRILIAMSRPVLATALLFVRAGAWVLVLVPAMWLMPELRTLNSVFIAWTFGVAIACFIGVAKVSRLGHWDLRKSIDWSWIRKGIRVAVPLLMATLAFKALGTFDRYWMEAIGGLGSLAAYVLFVGIANAIKAFLDAGVFIFCYPALISAARRGDDAAFRGQMRKMALQATVATVGPVALVLAMVGPLLTWIDRPLYRDYLELLYWSIAAVVLYAAGMIFHYGIYARHRDSAIVQSQFGGLVAFMASAALLQGWLGVMAVPIAVCIAHASITVWKAVTYFRSHPRGLNSVPDHG
jgi:O-antigen/teichoic acid export membrane protein